MPWYRSEKNPGAEHGKIEIPTSDAEFAEGMKTGDFKKPGHMAYCVLLFYSAVRKGEASRAIMDDFQVSEEAIIWNVGPRFKKNKYRKLCPQCKDQNSSKAQFCKMCAQDLSSLKPELVKAKTVTTPPLTLPLSAPYMNLLKEAIEEARLGGPGTFLFPYCLKTCYNIVHRVWNYPHLFRLSRITWFFQHGYTPIQVRTWTGLSLQSLDYYAGLVSTIEMGVSMAGNKKE